MQEKYDYAVLGMGKMLRTVADQGGELGEKIKVILDKGDLVPNELTIDILKQHLATLKEGQGFILDGFPRNHGQVQDMKKVMELDAVVVFNIGQQEALNRTLYRLICPEGHIYNSKTNPSKQPDVCDVDGLKLTKRDDDEEQAILNRLKIYHTETAEVLDYYRQSHKLIDIDGEQPIAKVFEDLEKELSKL